MPWRNLIPWKRSGTKRREAAAEPEERSPLALQRDINREFEEFWRNSFWGILLEPFDDDLGTFDMPKVEVEEGKKRVTVTAEVPGLSEQDVELTLSPAGDVLHLRGERQHKGEHEDRDRRGYRYEPHHGVVKRSIDLPSPVKTEGAEATLTHGSCECASIDKRKRLRPRASPSRASRP